MARRLLALTLFTPVHREQDGVSYSYSQSNIFLYKSVSRFQDLIEIFILCSLFLWNNNKINYIALFFGVTKVYLIRMKFFSKW